MQAMTSSAPCCRVAPDWPTRAAHNPCRGIGFGSAERRRSRTDRAVGYTTALVLKTPLVALNDALYAWCGPARGPLRLGVVDEVRRAFVVARNECFHDLRRQLASGKDQRPEDPRGRRPAV